MKHCIAVVLLIVSFATALQAGEAESVYLYVEMYAVSKDAYCGDTPINAVLRTPRSSILGSSKCFPGLVKSYREEGKECPYEWMSFYKRCKKQIAEAIQRAPAYSDTYPPDVQIVRLNKDGGAVMSVRRFFGGSGGGRYDWSLFLLRWHKNDKSSCPSAPFFSGVEVIHGGNVWRETSCRKHEPLDACIERYFYPKNAAFRLEFGTEGTRMHRISAGSKLPIEDQR
jgi:hypothetical protein